MSSLSLEDKLEVLKWRNCGLSSARIAEEFNAQVAESVQWVRNIARSAASASGSPLLNTEHERLGVGARAYLHLYGQAQLGALAERDSRLFAALGTSLGIENVVRDLAMAEALSPHDKYQALWKVAVEAGSGVESAAAEGAQAVRAVQEALQVVYDILLREMEAMLSETALRELGQLVEGPQLLSRYQLRQDIRKGLIAGLEQGKLSLFTDSEKYRLQEAVGSLPGRGGDERRVVQLRWGMYAPSGAPELSAMFGVSEETVRCFSLEVPRRRKVGEVAAVLGIRREQARILEQAGLRSLRYALSRLGVQDARGLSSQGYQ